MDYINILNTNLGGDLIVIHAPNSSVPYVCSRQETEKLLEKLPYRGFFDKAVMQLKRMIFSRDISLTLE